MTHENEPSDAGKGSLWPTRILWAGIGAFGISAVNAGAMVTFGWNMDSIATAVDIVTSMGLLATAAWAGAVGVETMRASRASSRAAMTANEQAARDSHEAARPYVDALIVPGLAGPTSFDLLIRNSGKTAARGVRLWCNAKVDRDDLVTRSIREMFDTPRTIGPGVSLRSIWQIGQEDAFEEAYDGDGEPIEGTMGMPDEAEIGITYKSNAGEETYSETMDVKCFHSGLWPVPDQGSEPLRKNGATEMRHLHSTLRAIARHVGEINR